MAKYRCNNKDCSELNKEVRATTHIKYKDYTSTDTGAPCPKCGEIREMVFEGLCTNMKGGNGNICNK